MEWAKIRRMASTVAELARLLPEDSASRLAVFDGVHYWEEILAIVETEMAREEAWGNSEDLYRDRLNELRSQLLGLVEFWNALIFPKTVVVPLENQCTLTQVLNLRRRRTFDLA